MYSLITKLELELEELSYTVLEIELHRMDKHILVVFVASVFVNASAEQTTTTTSATPNQCEEGWISFDSHCYLIVQEYNSWDNASSYCECKESYLVEIDTDTELNFLRDEVLSVLDNPMFWIGATLSITCEETFRYRRTGELVPNEYWAEGQPYVSEDQFCVGMMLYEEDFGMHCTACCKKMYFVCEKKMI